MKRCRIVVTGSYHAGVFALSQGIPVVCLAKSHYYIDKFLGLADQFRAGCQLVFLNQEALSERFLDSIEKAWESAEDTRLPLLEAADRQVEMSRKAYKRLYELVSTKIQKS